MSLEEAAAQGITRVRKPIWAIAEDHLEVDIVNGKLGVWCRLYSPFNPKCNGQDPISMPCLEGRDEREWLAYTGPVADSDEYRARVAEFGDPDA